MDKNIDHVIAEYLGTGEPLVEGKGEITDITGGGESGFSQYIFKISVGKHMGVIVMDGRIKGIGIDEKPHNEEEK